MAARKDLDRHLEREELLPVYALASSEALLRTEAVDALRARALTRAADFNRDEFRVGEVTVDKVVAAARTMPMMAPRRWVHLADVHKLRADDQDSLLTYLEAPASATTLCLSGEKVDLRTKLGARLSKANALFVIEPPRQQHLAAWITQRAQRRSIRIEADAARLLADLVGVDVGPLERAIDKLALYAGDGAPITADHVEELVAPTRVHSIFNLTDAIGERDLGLASELLRNALDGGENALMVLTMVARQLRQLIRVQELDGPTGGSADFASELGVPPFLVEPLRRQARRYRPDELSRALLATARADLRLKSTRLAPGVVLDQLLLDVMPMEGQS